ncbi:hypothetical protein ACFQ14_12595 [Pseudahrensia aquimaris]|uniref:Uncharacterized protein n=1 Tax=Pseudahrensia aquimaris TaxID=744461 RepID=A0ABW3FFI4_9HYPH
MAIELASPALRGGVVIAFGLYVAASYVVTGQVVGDRMAQKLDWQNQCQLHLAASIIEESESNSSMMPKMDCGTLSIFVPNGAEFCARHGDTIETLTGLKALRQQQQALEARNRRARERAVAQTSSRCTCAVSLTLEKHRLPLAIHAGSARLITPAPVKNLGSELSTSLRAPLCAADSGRTG